MTGFVERCMRIRLTNEDRQRIWLRSRVNTDELMAKYKNWQEQMLASDEQRAQAEQYWALRNAQRAHWRKSREEPR